MLGIGEKNPGCFPGTQQPRSWVGWAPKIIWLFPDPPEAMGQGAETQGLSAYGEDDSGIARREGKGWSQTMGCADSVVPGYESTLPVYINPFNPIFADSKANPDSWLKQTSLLYFTSQCRRLRGIIHRRAPSGWFWVVLFGFFFPPITNLVAESNHNKPVRLSKLFFP